MAERTTDERVAVIEETVLELKSRLFGNGQPGVIDRHDQRLASLENYRWLIAGALTMFMSAVAVYAVVK